MNYRHIYMLIIEHAKSEQKLGLRPRNTYDYRKNFKNHYFEFHHILPRKLYPLWSKNWKNIVPLTAREHYFCHELLYKIFPCRETFNALVLITTDRKHHVTNRQYERAKLLNSRLMHDKMIGKKKSIESVNKSAHTRTGSKRTEEQKQHMRDAQLAYYKSERCLNRHSGMLGKKQKDSFYERRHIKRVLCIETNEVFLSVGKVKEKLVNATTQGIYKSCITGKPYKGFHYKYIG